MVKKTQPLEWLDCSESQLKVNLAQWYRTNELHHTLIFLEGEMGSGKSTLARYFLEHLAPGARSAGSPTFPIMQEYRNQAEEPIFHLDLYRLKSEEELRDSGIETQIEDEATVLIEWASLFSDYFSYWFKQSPTRRKKVLTIHIAEGNLPDTRNYRFEWH